MYQRKTYDEYEIQGDYGQGWECVATEETMKAAREQLKCYRENEPNYPHRIAKKRVKKGRRSHELHTGTVENRV